ncbi:MAG TPA: FAD-dependent oxidoreductase [Acidimicrobiales bacterium]|nr:FAD-dependent oxidoreductase [Acidimicrobiales bacterium]
MSGHEQVVVVGGGVGGLAAALALGRAGHPVTVLERDPLPVLAGPHEAFATERRGAPQSHQTHGFLARIVAVLTERFPDVLADLRAAGCVALPGGLALGEPQPGDEDLVVLAMRRTTFEWVLRRAVLAEPGVDVRTGAGVTGLTAERPPVGPPRVDGVVLDDGTTFAADVVIAATGRRGPVRAWLAGVGVEVDETIRESGLMYLTRWYRLPAGPAATLDPRLGGDLGYVKYLGVPGDGGTLSITLAIRSADASLRTALSDPDRFEQACRALPGPDQFFAGGPLRPLGTVRPMGGLLNRLRRFLDAAGRPAVLGFHAVGDAHTCTNPLYGRGCSLALVQATLLADAMAGHPGDALGRALAYEAASAREIEPWYHLAVQTDGAGTDPDGDPGEDDPDGDGTATAQSPQARAMAALVTAGTTDPVIGRALSRLWNLLARPDELAADPVVAGRMAAVLADPDAYPPPPRVGPTRRELLDLLAAEEATTRA